MSKVVFILAFGVFGAVAQVKNYTPVTEEMLLNPPASDWLMFSRTYDGQRFSPLNQINSRNVAQLRTAWSRGIGAGTLESIPLVHNGVMYVLGPSATILALDATDGELLWQYKREVPANVASQSRAKTLSIYDDVIVYTSPDSFVVGLDARTGERRWETKADTRGHTSGSIVVDGMAISAGTCNGLRSNCYIAAHDAKTLAPRLRLEPTTYWLTADHPRLAQPSRESRSIVTQPRFLKHRTERSSADHWCNSDWRIEIPGINVTKPGC